MKRNTFSGILLILIAAGLTACVGGSASEAAPRDNGSEGPTAPVPVRPPRPAPENQSDESAGSGPRIAGCPVFPSDNIWNVRIDQAPVHARSAEYVRSIGADRPLHPDFGSGVWPPGSRSPIGIPFVVVRGDGQSRAAFTFEYADESDPGPYPIPDNAPIEGGPDASNKGDRHVIVIDRDNCKLYEVYAAYRQTRGRWRAGSGAVFDLKSNQLRPDGWTSADAAGLPIFPGLVRYEEVQAGLIAHAIRFTAPRTQRAYVWPATHFASRIKDPAYPPLGQRFRLRAGVDATKRFSPETRVIVRAMREYGMILADNGSPWFISGAPNEKWNNSILRELKTLRGSDFEAVDVSGLQAQAGSAAVRGK